MATRVVATFWLPFWATVFPVVGLTDAWRILQFPLDSAVTHPLAYAFTVGRIVQAGADLGRPAAAVPIVGFQALAALYMLGRLMAWLALTGIPRWALLLVGAWLRLSPLVANYVIARVKDIPYTWTTKAAIPATVATALARDLPRRRALLLEVPWVLASPTRHDGGLMALRPSWSCRDPWYKRADGVG